MDFIADFHVHSKYSRATARNLDLENLYIAAQIKGVTIVGTGDFTHPAWFAEIIDKLEPAEPGLFKLKSNIAKFCDEKVPQSCKGTVRFILTTEISSIYKKDQKTRKNHSLIFLPDLESVNTFNSRLDKIGNLKSDGRPILGLDVKHLLEILLGVNDDGFLIPAHIWTPWFSLLGSKSGFNSIKECFEDLSSHIFAVETGLSSDPQMNHRVSWLDGITLVSNSDAHSPSNLGRESNRFNTELSYHALKSAMETGNPEQFLGTFEFFPEEGKYHYDGHRKCNVCFHPNQSIKQNNICPICKKPLTLGVLYRIFELADREDGIKPKTAHPFENVIPLTDVLAEIFNVGSGSKKVVESYDRAICALGPEFKIQKILPADELDKAGIPLLSEAIRRMRKKNIYISPGYDGEYGKVSIFKPGERRELAGQKSLFSMSSPQITKKPSVLDWKLGIIEEEEENEVKVEIEIEEKKEYGDKDKSFEKAPAIVGVLNEEQQKAVKHEKDPLLIIAGPGTGKTQTLTHKIAHIINEKKVAPENILAVTFTNKAAQEMKERMDGLIGKTSSLPLITTFHSFCYKILTNEAKEKNHPIRNVIDDADQFRLFSEVARQAGAGTLTPQLLSELIISAKENLFCPDDDLSRVCPKELLPQFYRGYRTYQEILSFQNLMDYEDLIFNVVQLLENNLDARQKYTNLFRYIFVDEYQDINCGQYRIIRALSPAGINLCAIGDPDQSIYGFRGSDLSYFFRFAEDFKNAKIITLKKNYRSTETILESSFQVIRNNTNKGFSSRLYSGIKGIDKLGIIECASEKSEAVAIGKTIEQMIGGASFQSFDFRKNIDFDSAEQRGFSDFAILYRTKSQGEIILEILEKAGIPCQTASKSKAFSEKGIPEIISLFKLINGLGAFFDLEKILKLSTSGIGEKTISSFSKWFYQKKTGLSQALLDARRFPIPGIEKPSQLKLDRIIVEIDNLTQASKGKTVYENLQCLTCSSLLAAFFNNDDNSKHALNFLLNLSGEHQTDPRGFLTSIALQTDTDIYDKRAQKVSLMTMHAAKGLEFPVVFIAGCEDDLIPYGRLEEKKIDAEEERRLFYVAMTRAKERLFLTWAKKRLVYGKMLERKISPFVEEIEKRLLNHQHSFESKKKQTGHVQLKLF